MWVVAGHPPAICRVSSRVVRYISRENRSTGWQPETDRTRLSNFIPWIRPPLLQWNPFENFEKRQNAANLCVFAHLQQASQASDVGSIPIARSNVPRRPNGAVGGWNNAAAD